MQPTVIQEATVATLPALSRLFSQAVEAHFTYFPPAVRARVVRDHSVRKLFQAAIDAKRVVLIAKQGHQIIGYCFGAAPKQGPAQIYWLYVEPNFRGSKIGTTLLTRTVALLVAKGARTIAIATHDHTRYYEAQGFKFVKKTVIDTVDMDILSFEAT